MQDFRNQKVYALRIKSFILAVTYFRWIVFGIGMQWKYHRIYIWLDIGPLHIWLTR